ncbi:MAG: hydroxyacylglutathione hydrolase [Prochlorococcus sp.]|nr:hydroxyacylglutathione hydrolase [Prochlorococcaceae cyanobacterium ETNP18_MAG_1]
MDPTSMAFSSHGERNGIHAIEVLDDNIIWIWTQDHQAVVVDPAISEPVQKWLEQRQLDLVAVLQTHHHQDHIGGTRKLLKRWPEAAVIAAAADRDRIPFQTVSVGDGDHISLLNRPVEVIDVAGHTRAHVAYHLPTSQKGPQDAALFCGDTLFGAGCGRLFEGTAEDMHRALKRLCSLAPETKVYCAHEYTEANLRWAAAMRPDDQAIRARLADVSARRGQGKLSLPSSIEEEQLTNLFVRAKSSEELASLRQSKNEWQG